MNSINKAIDNGYKEYAVIYSNLKSGDNMSRLFFTNEDIIKIKNDSYLNNAGTTPLHLVVRDMKDAIVYSTMKETYPLAKKMDTFQDENTTNYVITNDQDLHNLIINKKITLGNEEYYLTYISDIETLYQDKVNYFLILMMFDIIAGIASIIVIYYFANAITKPLHAFIDNINEIINKDYTTKLENTSDIEEINSLRNSFNIMNDEISSQIIMLETKNQEKQRFIDSLTHEIRTPLTSIIGYSSLCLHKDINDTATVRKALENIYANGKRMESLTENLIKLITMDKVNLDMQELSLLNILSNIKNTFNTILLDQHVEIHIIGEDIHLISDEYLITTLFTNFIDNAIKATKEKTERCITITLNENTIIIADNGKGIPQEDMDKIFEPFFMLDKARQRTMTGFGLGLAICQSILSILDINFAIESQEHIGTKIMLTWNGGYEHEKQA